MSELKQIFDEIEVNLKEPYPALVALDCLNANVQKVRKQIQTTFNNRLHQLKSREQCLLNQVNNIAECLTTAAQKNSAKFFEEKGKLGCFVEVANTIKGNEEFTELLKQTLQSYKEMQLQRTDASSLSFYADECELDNVIRRFGEVSSSLMERDDCSDFSWDLTDSDGESVDVITHSDFETCCEKNGCNPCKMPYVEIEEINKVFGEGLKIGILDDVCKANEKCTSYSDCVCGEPCYAQSNPEEEEKYPKYVKAISDAFLLIKDGDEYPENNTVQSGIKPDSSEKFDMQISKLEEQFNKIKAGAYNPPSAGIPPVWRQPWSVDQVMDEINAIVNCSAKEALTTGVDKSHNTSDPFFSLTNKLTGILSGEITTLEEESDALPDKKSPQNPAPNLNTEISKLTKQLNNIIGDGPGSESMPEKADEEKPLVDHSHKWTTVHQLHSVIAGIVES